MHRQNQDLLSMQGQATDYANVKHLTEIVAAILRPSTASLYRNALYVQVIRQQSARY